MSVDAEKLRATLLDELIDQIGLVQATRGPFTVTNDGLMALTADMHNQVSTAFAEWRRIRARLNDPDATLSLEGTLFNIAATAFAGIESIRTAHPR